MWKFLIFCYMRIDRHHLLECILWPNGDGTFRKIVNTENRLRELGIYDDWKLTIPIEHGTHQSMHHEFKKGTEYSRDGEKHPMYGKHLSDETRRKISENTHFLSGVSHPMYGRKGEKNPMWKGDNATPSGLYKRALKLYKAGEISNEEFQPYRDARLKYKKSRPKRSG